MSSSGTQLQRGRHKKAFLYHQVGDLIRADIDAGNYAPGERLPGMEELATQLSVTKITVRRALQELQNEGLLEIEPARGCFVSGGVAVGQPPEKWGSGLLSVGIMSQVIVADRMGLYHMEMLDALRQALSPMHASMVVLPMAQMVAKAGSLRGLMKDSPLDGVVYIGHFTDKQLAELVQTGPPAVLLDHHVDGLTLDTVTLDNRKGGQQAIEHLLKLGHTQVAVVTGEDNQAATRKRMNGVYDALGAAGLGRDAARVVSGNFTRESGERAAHELLQGDDMPTGIFCMNDEMALGCVQVARQLGLRVPDDLSVIGFDDVYLAQASHPPLTTVSVPIREMGTLAVQALRDRMAQPDRAAARILLATSVVKRQSTAKPRA